jgi:hypothetical protein
MDLGTATPLYDLPVAGVSSAPKPLAPPVPTAPTPEHDYVAPTGTTLPADNLRALAMTVAARQADDSSPSSIGLLSGTLRQAAEAIDPQFTAPPSTSAGITKWYQSQVDVLVLHGHFTLPTAPRPSGVSAPTGTVLTLVVDAHTGAIDGERLDDQDSAGLNQLGAADALR